MHSLSLVHWKHHVPSCAVSVDYEPAYYRDQKVSKLQRVVVDIPVAQNWLMFRVRCFTHSQTRYPDKKKQMKWEYLNDDRCVLVVIEPSNLKYIAEIDPQIRGNLIVQVHSMPTYLDKPPPRTFHYWSFLYELSLLQAKTANTTRHTVYIVHELDTSEPIVNLQELQCFSIFLTIYLHEIGFFMCAFRNTVIKHIN